MSAGDEDDRHRRLAQGLARKTGIKTRGPAGTPVLPTCVQDTVDAAGRDRECGRIATHRAWYPAVPALPSQYCAYHAVEAAGRGETFEPTFWLSEVGKDFLEDAVKGWGKPQLRPGPEPSDVSHSAADIAPGRGGPGTMPEDCGGGSAVEGDAD